MKQIIFCEHQYIQIGDRIHLQLQPNDDVLSAEQWRKDLVHEITSLPDSSSSCVDVSKKTQSSNENGLKNPSNCIKNSLMFH